MNPKATAAAPSMMRHSERGIAWRTADSLALRSIVRRDSGETYQDFLTRLAQASGIETPTRADLARLDRKRPKKGRNKDWRHPHDPDARITKLKDGRTHLAHKAEHAVDMETGAVVGVTVQGADQGDTTTIADSVTTAAEELEAVAATTDGHTRVIEVSLRNRRHAAHASARPPEHFEAAVDPRGSVQPEPDPAQADGGGHAAGMEQPRGPASFASLFPAFTPGRSESAMQRSNLEIPRGILSESTKPPTPFAVSKSSSLHHGLLGGCSAQWLLRGAKKRRKLVLRPDYIHNSS